MQKRAAGHTLSLSLRLSDGPDTNQDSLTSFKRRQVARLRVCFLLFHYPSGPFELPRLLV